MTTFYLILVALVIWRYAPPLQTGAPETHAEPIEAPATSAKAHLG